MHPAVVVIAICAVIFPTSVYGHGMMIDPVSRASRWRKKFAGPIEYTDNQLSCGGKNVQWEKHDGKCGACGDEYGIDNPRFVYPGAFARNPPIVKTYQEGQQIDVKVKITANHKGYFIFRLAPLVKQPITQNELNKIMLRTLNGDAEWKLPSGAKIFTIKLQLPKGVTCKHCVMQWWYTGGNNPNTNVQETFVNCADIAILPEGENSSPPQKSGPTCPPKRRKKLRLRPALPFEPTIKPRQRRPFKPSGKNCHALFKRTRPGMDEWCRGNCALGNCPARHCVCD